MSRRIICAVLAVCMLTSVLTAASYSAAAEGGVTDKLSASNCTVHFATPVSDQCTLDIQTAEIPAELVKADMTQHLYRISVMKNNQPMLIENNVMTIIIVLGEDMRGFETYRIGGYFDDGKSATFAGAIQEDGIVRFTASGVGKQLYCLIEAKDKHIHSFNSPYFQNKEGHWRACTCGEKTKIQPHTYSAWKTIVKATYSKPGQEKRACTVCGRSVLKNIPKKRLNNPEKLTVKMLGKGKAKLSWSKVDGAKGYEIFMSGKKSSGFKTIKKVKTGAKLTFTQKGLKANKFYYFKIRAYTVYQGKTYRSAMVKSKGSRA